MTSIRMSPPGDDEPHQGRASESSSSQRGLHGRIAAAHQGGYDGGYKVGHRDGYTEGHEAGFRAGIENERKRWQGIMARFADFPRHLDEDAGITLTQEENTDHADTRSG